ncbi:putative SUN domain-containing protein 2-like [Capsicum annuum]|nr:putative SUN domain-containing protein 2-like [Capsicum annuum]
MEGSSKSNASVQQLTAEAAAQLQEGIGMVLSRWTALQMAIENEWGGRGTREKSNQLNIDIFFAFSQSKEQVYMDDIEEILDEFMISLNTEVNDGSLEEVAEKLMYMHEECLDGNFNSIKMLRETNVGRKPATYVRQYHSPMEVPYNVTIALLNIAPPDASDDDDSSNEGDDRDKNLRNNSSDMAIDSMETQSSLGQDMMVEPAIKKPAEVDDDGWTTVATRRNKVPDGFSFSSNFPSVLGKGIVILEFQVLVSD